MNVTLTESPRLSVTGDEITESHLEAMENHIRELRGAVKVARLRYLRILAQGLMVRCRLLYLFVARFFRETVAPFLGWRWAVVLIGTTLFGALFFVLFLSWVAGLWGIALGATVFASLVGFPSDSHLTVNMRAAEGTLAQLGLRRNEGTEALSQMRRELSDAIENQRQLADRLRQHRQSRQYRLQQLAARNWRAMRGGDLETFLEKVFSELQYSVERTGGAGDQGVDLITERDGHRIALQVKGYLDSVPNTAIQEAFTGMAFYKCDTCAVITNSRFTTGGKNIASSVGCALIDENTLPMLIVGQIDLWQETLAAKMSAQPELRSEGHQVSDDLIQEEYHRIKRAEIDSNEKSVEELAEIYCRYAKLKGWSTEKRLVRSKVQAWLEQRIGAVGLAIEFHESGLDGAKHLGYDAESRAADPSHRIQHLVEKIPYALPRGLIAVFS